MDNEDAALLAALSAGEGGAFARLVDRHQGAVRAFLRRLLGDHADADDLAQETFIAAWSSIGAFRGGSSLRTWLCGIAWRKARSAQRSWFRARTRDRAWGEQRASEAPIAAASEDAMAVKQALGGLPLEQRAAVALCLAGDFSHSDAAEVLNMPLGTVKSHVTRGKAKLLQTLGERS